MYKNGRWDILGWLNIQELTQGHGVEAIYPYIYRKMTGVSQKLDLICDCSGHGWFKQMASIDMMTAVTWRLQ